MQNKMNDLDNHLFEQIERLKDEDLTDAQFKVELSRSKAMVEVASQIIESRKLQLDCVKLIGTGKVHEDVSKQITWNTDKK